MNALKNNLGCGFGVGLPHGHGRKQENTFLCFPKAKAQQEKIPINFLKKSSQYFHIRFLFVLFVGAIYL